MNSVLWLIISLSAVIHAEKTEEDDQNRANHSIHLDCFDVFIPLINRLSNEAKETSGNCVTNAEVQRERELQTINRTRSDVFSEVKRIKETLSTCSSNNDHLGYFDCLKAILEHDRKVVGEITMKSSKYSNKMKEIEEQKIICFRNSVFKIRERSSNAIHSLQYCLTSNGESAKSRDTATTGMHTTTPYYRYQRNY